MSRDSYIVYIPHVESVDFEKFLYDELAYPCHGYTRIVDHDCQVYTLDLEKNDLVMITLRYHGAHIVPYGGHNSQAMWALYGK